MGGLFGIVMGVIIIVNRSKIRARFDAIVPKPAPPNPPATQLVFAMCGAVFILAGIYRIVCVILGIR